MRASPTVGGAESPNGLSASGSQDTVSSKSTKRVLVTGGTGFLGRRLVQQLLQEGCEVRCSVRPSSDLDSLREFVGQSWTRVEFQQANLESAADCDQLVLGCDVIYHAAAALRGAASTMFRNTVIPTRRLIDAAVKMEVNRFVLVSSIAVYHTFELRNKSLLDENCPLEPKPHLRDPYTHSKVVQERVAWEAYNSRQLPLVVVRPGVIFGPERGALSDRIGLKIGGIRFRMGGRQQLPYTYVDNCAAAVVLAGLTPQIEGQAFNIVDDEQLTGRKVLKAYRIGGQKVSTIGIPRWAIGPLSGFYDWYHRWSQGQVPPIISRYRSSALWKPLQYTNQKAKSLLDWKPVVDWDDAFQQTISV